MFHYMSVNVNCVCVCVCVLILSKINRLCSSMDIYFRNKCISTWISIILETRINYRSLHQIPQNVSFLFLRIYLKRVFLEKNFLFYKNNICMLIETQIPDIGFLKSQIFGVGFFTCNPSCLSTGGKKWQVHQGTLESTIIWNRMSLLCFPMLSRVHGVHTRRAKQHADHAQLIQSW